MKRKYTVDKFLSAALALCLMLAVLPGAGASPAPSGGSCGPDAEYYFEDGVLTISGTGPVGRVPWGKTTMTNLGLLPYITSVVIEDGITELPDYAFSGANRLTGIRIPDSVVSIGYRAFSGTPWLDGQAEEFVVAGGGVLLAYNGLGGAVTIPNTVCSIAGGAFAGSDITAVTIGSSVEGIGSYAFSNCSKLERISIADTVTWIGERAFDGTPWLEAQSEDFVIVGDGVLVAYNGPGGSVAVPNTVRFIAVSSLSFDPDDDGISITEVTIPDSVIKIDGGAFSGGYPEPFTIHGALGSVAQQYVEARNSTYNLFRFVPFGQEDGSLFNFIVTQNYYGAATFPDVDESAWYNSAVETVYKRQLMKGTSDWDWDKGIDATFTPDGNISVAEAITVAARVRDTYYYEQNEFVQGEPWYGVYVDYALEHGILAGEPDDYERPATRAEFAALLAAALPARDLEAIHENVSFTDVSQSHPNYEAVMLLSQAGVMQGKGEGVFDPDAPVLRCEAAAMLSRCVCPDQRIQPD